MSHETPTLSSSESKVDRNRGLGTVLRLLRRDAKATQADIAEALDLERTSICNIENGLQAMTIEKLHDFAERVGCEVTLTFRPKRRSANAPLKRELVLGEACAQ